ncbi:type II secretion system F family protein [Desulfitispora alkaliphila]|uniref:type II secretion system F family protein n=1 Tax=Desulfitispora alkaliphila TaxID=622674 RepID=UPI003D1F42B3
MIAKNSSPPVSQEFQRVIDEVNMGKSYEEAFAKMIERCPLEDLEVLINAILLSKESGGNLSHVLDTVSETIRDRERLSREVKSLTSQGRLSGYILALLPIGLFLLIFIISPDYVTPFLENPMGKILLFGVLCSQIIGFYFIKKIVQVEW